MECELKLSKTFLKSICNLNIVIEISLRKQIFGQKI